MLVLTGRDVRRLLDLDALIDAVERAMIELSNGAVSVPERIAAAVPERYAMVAAMPAYLPAAPALVTKLVSVFPLNRERPTHQAVLLCFDPDTGTPSALMDATYLTEARTAAGSAVATRLLARPDARLVAVLGTGVQARAHAEAMCRVRPVQEIVVAGRSPERAAHLAAELDSALAVPRVSAGSFEEAVARADIVCAATHSPNPVVERAWLRPGTHINSVGYNTEGREIDADTVAGAVVVVESRASALAPPPSGANDLTWPIRDGIVGEDHVAAEIGEVAAGHHPGRTSPDEVTLYKSVGSAAQDAAAAALVLAAAQAQGTGRNLDL